MKLVEMAAETCPKIDKDIIRLAFNGIHRQPCDTGFIYKEVGSEKAIAIIMDTFDSLMDKVKREVSSSRALKRYIEELGAEVDYNRYLELYEEESEEIDANELIWED